MLILHLLWNRWTVTLTLLDIDEIVAILDEAVESNKAIETSKYIFGMHLDAHKKKIKEEFVITKQHVDELFKNIELKINSKP